jgi:hypothetical protein
MYVETKSARRFLRENVNACMMTDKELDRILEELCDGRLSVEEAKQDIQKLTYATYGLTCCANCTGTDSRENPKFTWCFRKNMKPVDLMGRCEDWRGRWE